MFTKQSSRAIINSFITSKRWQVGTSVALEKPSRGITRVASGSPWELSDK